MSNTDPQRAAETHYVNVLGSESRWRSIPDYRPRHHTIGEARSHQGDEGWAEGSAVIVMVNDEGFNLGVA